jgi:predicted dehydrogenase
MRRIGVVVNGVTGRMGYRQHLVRSLLAIREQGGVELRDGSRLMPELVLAGRREERVRAIAERHGVERWTTDVAAALEDADVYFDAQVTPARAAALRAAIAAGKHVYTEKPTAEGLDEALELARLADEAGVRHGVVQDKLFLPGLLKLRRLVEGGFFGRILSVRGEFGYWIFEGDWQAPNRPSWNYRAEEGGGIALDMLCHWRYVLDNVIAPVRSVSATVATHIPERLDEAGERYAATADDAAYATFELDGGVIAHINSSWTVRVFRDELVEFQVDGTEGSAVAGLRRCRFQHRAGTPRAVWNPDVPATEDFRSQWAEVPDNDEFDNAFKVQWEKFLRHVADGEEFPWNLWEGAKGVQLAELGLRSAAEGRRLEVPPIVAPRPAAPSEVAG